MPFRTRLPFLLTALVPLLGGAEGEPTPPVSIPLQLAFDGTVAVGVSDAQGKLVRRLGAEERRKSGALAQGWDLRAEDGTLVGPGTYRWTAVAVPEIKLTYEGTVNNAGQPAWFCPAPGKGGGGWMADHAPSTAVCAVGDLLFIGSPCAESGHAAIAVDRDGNKLWGIGQVGGGFIGADRIATDGRYAYLMNSSVVMRIDPADGFAQKIIHRFAWTQELPGPGGSIGGRHGDIAIRGDRLFLAIDAASVRLRGTTDSAAVDYAVCQPPVPGSDGDEDTYSAAQRWATALGLLGSDSSSQQAMLGPALPDGPLAGTITVVFKKPVPVGSLLLSDGAAEAWVLKPDADLAAAGITRGAPAAGLDEAQADVDPFNEDLWEPLHTVPAGTKPKGGVALASLAAPLRTRAIRFKSPGKHITFALPFDRRYADVAATAACTSADGKSGALGAWMVQRDPATRPISPTSQPAMLLTWPAPQRLRGLAFIKPNQAYFAVDVWTGAGAPDAAAESGWREVGSFGAQMFGPRVQTANVRLVDFGEEVSTAAVRVRAFRPAGHRGYMGYENLPVTGPHVASIERVVAFAPQGGDLADLPPDLSQRISEFRIAGDKLEPLHHVPLPHPGWLAFAPDGTLYATSNDAVVTVDPATGKTTPVIPASALQGPADMAFDRDGNLLLTQAGACAVNVYDRAGKLLRAIGGKGLREVGPYDGRRFRNPGSVAVASDGKVWIVEMDYRPKRISRWSADGATLEKEFFGPTQYGGGGWLDPRDPGVLYYNGLKFRMDWKTRASVLEAMVFSPGEGPSLRAARPDRPHYIGDRRYLLGDPGGDNGGDIAVVCVEQDGKALALAAAGNLAQWGDVDADPALRAAFAQRNRGALGFVWTDRNGDHRPQPDEVQLVEADPLNPGPGPGFDRIGDDLTLHFGSVYLRPVGMTPAGAPIYDPTKVEKGVPGCLAWSLADGTMIVSARDGVHLTEADGRTDKWFFRDDYYGVHGSHKIGYERPAGMLVGTDHLLGNFTIGQERLYAVAGNHGDWYVFTQDGLIAACLSGGPGKFGKRFWTVPEWEAGKTDLSGLCVGEEHFGGSVIRAADGRVLMVAGHNHNSIVRVDGLERLSRTSGTITVTAEDVEKTRAYDVQRQIAERAKLGPRTLTMPLSESAGIIVDGKTNEWNSSNFITIEDHYDETAKRRVIDVSGGLAADAENLYIAGMVTDETPLLNAATDPSLVFKGGDAFDVTIALDPAAKAGRANPVAGDLRIVLAPLKGGAVAVAYQPVVPGTAPDARKVFTATVKTTLDKVFVVAEAKVAFARTPRGWTVEAAIPWSAIGHEPPEAGQRLSGDLGVLKSDQNGVATVIRAYWAGKGQTIVSDIASEVRLIPALWGEVKVVAEDGIPGAADDALKTR